MKSLPEYKHLPQSDSKSHTGLRPFQKMLGFLSFKRKVIILGCFNGGVIWASELLRKIRNISGKALTKTSRELEISSSAARTIYPVIPPKVDYRYIELGDILVVALTAGRDWAIDYKSRAGEFIESGAPNKK